MAVLCSAMTRRYPVVLYAIHEKKLPHFLEFVLSELLLVNQDGEPGAYRPPKIAPASMDADELRGKGAAGARGAKLPGAKGGKGGGSRSAFLKELAEELEGRPEEVGSRVHGFVLWSRVWSTENHTITGYGVRGCAP